MPDEPRSALVVDDDPVFRLWAQRVLEHDGFDVRTAQDLESALALVETREPDVVIVDITLGREDGFAVARRIRDAVPGLPLVIVSALVEIKHASRVYMGLPRPILLGKPMAAGAFDALGEQGDGLGDLNGVVSAFVLGQALGHRLGPAGPSTLSLPDASTASFHCRRHDPSTASPWTPTARTTGRCA